MFIRFKLYFLSINMQLFHKYFIKKHANLLRRCDAHKNTLNSRYAWEEIFRPSATKIINRQFFFWLDKKVSNLARTVRCTIWLIEKNY